MITITTNKYADLLMLRSRVKMLRAAYLAANEIENKIVADDLVSGHATLFRQDRADAARVLEMALSDVVSNIPEIEDVQYSPDNTAASAIADPECAPVSKPYTCVPENEAYIVFDDGGSHRFSGAGRVNGAWIGGCGGGDAHVGGRGGAVTPVGTSGVRSANGFPPITVPTHTVGSGGTGGSNPEPVGTRGVVSKSDAMRPETIWFSGIGSTSDLSVSGLTNSAISGTSTADRGCRSECSSADAPVDNNSNLWGLPDIDSMRLINPKELARLMLAKMRGLFNRTLR